LKKYSLIEFLKIELDKYNSVNNVCSHYYIINSRMSYTGSALTNTFPFPTVYIINLDSRPDRWETIKKTCYTCGIHPHRVSSVKASPGWHGCARSHMKVAELAQSRNEQWYIIMEDDAILSVDNWRRFVSLMPLLWAARGSWDIFNGGPGDISGFEMVSRDPILYKIKANLAHFLLINSSAYPIIKAWTPEKREVDNYFHDHTRMYATYPYISEQSGATSDIGIGDPIDLLKVATQKVKQHLIDNSVIEPFIRFKRPSLSFHQ